MRLRILLPCAALVALAAPAAASASFSHTVVPGESLYSIAAADGLSVSELAAANGLSTASPLIAGSTLQIPPQSPSATASTSATTATATATTGPTSAEPDGDDGGTSASASTSPSESTSSGGYLVQPGDTLSALASRAGTSVAALAAANGIDPNGILPAGAVLNVSGVASSAPSVSGASAATQPVGTAAEGSGGAPPYPTPERVSASEVGTIAAAHGVSPSLAAAIGWQESGFNNDLVSVAGARGVMQILPGTWDWIQRSLNAGTPLAPASALDNVRGGVLLLRSLLNSTGGDPALAAAGYYQGLPSVQRNGMFPETQRYVNSVMTLRSRFGG